MMMLALLFTVVMVLVVLWEKSERADCLGGKRMVGHQMFTFTLRMEGACGEQSRWIAFGRFGFSLPWELTPEYVKIWWRGCEDAMRLDHEGYERSMRLDTVQDEIDLAWEKCLSWFAMSNDEWEVEDHMMEVYEFYHVDPETERAIWLAEREAECFPESMMDGGRD